MSDFLGGVFAIYMGPIANIASRSYAEVVARNPDYLEQEDDMETAGLGGRSSRFGPVVLPAQVNRNQALFLVGSPYQIMMYLNGRGSEHVNVVDGTINISFRLPSDKTARQAAGIAKGVVAVVAYPAGVLAAGGIGAVFSPRNYDAAQVMRRRRAIEQSKTESAVVQLASNASPAFGGRADPPAAAGAPDANSYPTLQVVAGYLQGCGFPRLRGGPG